VPIFPVPPLRELRPPYHLIRAAVRRVFRSHRASDLPFAEAVRGRTWACTDLGAFPRPLPAYPGVDGVVIMEDRDPRFFLSHRSYTPDAETGLNRHGPLRAWSTQQDLRALVGQLRAQGIAVAIGCWNYGGWWLHRRPQWLRDHPELVRLPLTSQLFPFVRLRREGVTYAEYIAQQYARLRADFGFDGLMLGDGFCGFGSLWDPDLYRDQAAALPRWTEFYGVVAAAVHRAGGVLLAYDMMGVPSAEAREHGVDYPALADAGLDILVYQSYPQAWGGFWLETYRSRFDLAANVANLGTVASALAGGHAQVLYTVELGDSVERWRADADATRSQMARLDPVAPGRFLVWANDLFAQCGVLPVEAEAPTEAAASHARGR